MPSQGLKDAMLIAAVSGVTTLNVFFQGALTVALPTIGKDLKFSQADLQWPSNVYALAYGCLLLPFGRLGDIWGGRTMFLAGSAWFSLWSIATAFAPNDKAFIVFIALKGLGAAANTPAGVGLLSAHFPPGPRRNNAFGALAAGQPVGFIFGLVLGGILTSSKATWRAIFYIQTALGFVFVLMGWFIIAPTRKTKRYSKGLDWGGTVLSVVGLALLTYSLADSTTARKGWDTPQIPGLFSASIAVLAVFVYYERWREVRGKSVIMPFSMLRQPGTKLGSIISLLFFGWWSFNTMVYFITLYYQQVIQLNPLQTSIRFVPMAISGFLLDVLAGYVVSMVPGQPLMLAGLLGSIASALLFSLINVHSSYWTMAFFVMITVVGADIVYPVGNLHIAANFDEDSQSLAGGIFNVATRLGTSLGLAVTSSIATSTTARFAKTHPEVAAGSPEALMVGFRAAGWTCFAAAALSFVICAAGLCGIGIVGRVKDGDGEDDVSLHTVVGVDEASVEKTA